MLEADFAVVMDRGPPIPVTPAVAPPLPLYRLDTMVDEPVREEVEEEGPESVDPWSMEVWHMKGILMV